IIGLSCRLPGAPTAADFWSDLRAGVERVEEIPAERWDMGVWYDPNPAAPNRSTCRRAGILQGIDQFDPAFFGLSSREADHMLPEQRLFLEQAWRAMEDAGVSGPRASAGSTGVYVGVIPNEYVHSGMLRDGLRVEGNMATGNGLSIVANRVSYLLDLRGPSLPVDTACSSALVAVHLAVMSLRAGECDLALAGGVNVNLSLARFLAFSHARMFSTGGRCRPFDADADGYVCGEGVGAFVLKRLSDAQRNGDRVRAVILGSAVNQDGRSNGLTAPNGLAQRRVIEAAWANAGRSLADAGYFEAHGTGTPLGDPIEVEALSAALRAAGARPGSVGLGSVKGNVGHLEGAAGVASLTKVVLSLEAGQLPASLHFERQNPHLDLVSGPLYVTAPTRPWTGPRLAGVSSFGYGGTNVHLVVEAAPERPRANPTPGPRPLLLSARDPDALSALREDWARRLETSGPAEHADLCLTAAAGRPAQRHRLVVVAKDGAEAAKALRDGPPTAEVSGRARPRVALLFTGQGALYPGVGRALYGRFPAFRAAIDRCEAALGGALDAPLTHLLFEGEPALLEQTRYTQPLTFVLDWALAELWRSFGVEPAAVLGHSLGELVAATVAGVFEVEDALRVVVERARLMGGLPDGGAMLAVLADEATTLGALGDARGLGLAAVNGPAQVVLSGDAPAIEAAAETLRAAGLRVSPLKVSHAFHSHRMEPALRPFEAFVATVPRRAPRIPLLSNLDGRPVEDAALDPSYWARLIRAPVRFMDGARWLGAGGFTALLEAGPGRVLTPMAEAAVAGLQSPPVALTSLQRGVPEAEAVYRAAGRLWTLGVPIDGRALFAGEDLGFVEAPGHPMRPERHWLQLPAEAAPQAVSAPTPAPSAAPEPVVPPTTDLVGQLRRGQLSARDALAGLLRGRGGGQG
ncbi:type I polyketide synthase, partial [Myxococcota bacterium]|nr:type I polyketide synthase [Myxococcota bacterium]